jgi:uncharacterized protein (TIGR03435 family)
MFDAAPRRSGERISMHNCSLMAIVAWAYRIANPAYQIVPGRWEERLWEAYDIDAIAPAATSEGDLRLMFESLLEERFKFKSHLAAKGSTGYELVVVRASPRLIAAGPESRRSVGFGGSATWVAIESDGLRLVGKGASMAELAVVLGRRLQVPVVDRTELKGTYEYNLLFSAGIDPSDADAPLLETAIHDLGLTLRKTKVQYDQWIVDYVEKASMN